MTAASRVAAALESHLPRLGMHRSKGRRLAFQRDVLPDVTGGVVVDFSSAHLPPNVVNVDPLVFVTNWTISDIVAQLLGEKPRRVGRAGVRARLGYVMPEKRWRMWPVDVDAAMDDQIVPVVAAIRDYGMPWIESLSNFDVLADALLEAEPIGPGDILCRPVIRLLRDGPDAAISELNSLPARVARAWVKPAADELAAFAERFPAYVAESRSREGGQI